MTKSGKKNVAAIVCAAIPVTSYAGVDNIIILADPKMNSTIKIISAIILILKITAISLFFFFFEKIQSLTNKIGEMTYKCQQIDSVKEYFNSIGLPYLSPYKDPENLIINPTSDDMPEGEEKIKYRALFNNGYTYKESDDKDYFYCDNVSGNNEFYDGNKVECENYEELYNDVKYRKWYQSKYIKPVTVDGVHCTNFYLKDIKQQLLDYTTGMTACIVTQSVLYVSSIVFAAVINRK
tara:strand:- start:93 stop:803 length:711 start_codon:yes stop_codon:yes gene_type:complete